MTQDVTSTATRGQRPVNRRWRTVDIIVAAVVAVAFGVVFFAWGVLYNALTPVFVGFKPAQAVIYGMWLLPGVLGGLLIRKPGAAVFTELVAAVVSVLLGVESPLAIILYGLVQGLAAELVFAAFRYRRWRLPVALLAGAVAGVVPAVMDNVLYNFAWAPTWQLVYGVLVVVSSLVIAGAGSFALVRALAATGVLAPFASGREQTTR
ncbi:energy-coupling factor transport system substrate-specific component [Actinopolymorpha cephalotaxi]|uniref:Energy-coupling factor transport system substrate-specific component n=1 Tax=Actinopolymorpha cephalotaxi TaxID=504797 RepID=A0A1I2W5T3_9ACTN|nr:ECF transporter S component [Actinopolymorpha cephalotaxi]NYH82739.1 energy-coupling factor transport system substrate-specific component [Actinopolymorpha cephalotaxi]SFG96733.1 energy-coupling factor transport system substrate-specific component [Actinopolymorpha cephalotaxi]